MTCKRTPPPGFLAEIRRLFSYDNDTGILAWKVSRSNCVRIGQEAGSVQGKDDWPYRTVSVNGVHYMAHHLIWYFVTGEWPHGFLVDHRDGNGLNNRWLNLRRATFSQNVCNSKLGRSNTSGFKGVSFDRKSGRWHAQIMLDRKQKHLGRFPTPELAHAAYCHAAERLHGDFARFA